MEADPSSVNHGRAAPAATFVAPSVHEPPAGTDGAAFACADRPRQSFAGAHVHGMLLASSSFWLARKVAVDVWLPLCEAALEYVLTESRWNRAIVTMAAQTSTSARVNPPSSRRVRRSGNTCLSGNIRETLMQPQCLTRDSNHRSPQIQIFRFPPGGAAR